MPSFRPSPVMLMPPSFRRRKLLHMDDQAVASTTSKPSKDAPPTAILACEGCKQRKIRCDRAYPCAACRSSGRTCVAVVRPRLPRGRKGGRKETAGELKARINRLENLVQSLSDSLPAQAGEPDSVNTENVSSRSSSLSDPRPAASTRSNERKLNFQNQLGGSLWETLSREVAGIRSVLEEPDDEEDDDSVSPPANSALEDLTYANMLSTMSRPDSVQFPMVSRQALQVFARLYASNVDPPLKITYAPVLQSSIEHGTPYLDYADDSPAYLALKSSIFYACICSVTEPQCMECFGSPRNILQGLWRATSDAMLAKAGFITTTDLATLQAYVIYLHALRSQNSGRMVWTLTAMVIRIAQAMNLHREEALSSVPFFEAEMKRRLWYVILSLDLQGSMDRGTDPIVRQDDFTTRPPMNINDTDFHPGRTDPCLPRVGYADSTLLCIPAHLARLGRSINFVSPGDMLHKDCEAFHWDWNERIRSSSSWVHAVQSILPTNLKPKNLYERRCHKLVHVIATTIGIFVYRPMARHPALGPPPCDSNTILSLALASMEAFLRMQNDLQADNIYAWSETGFVPWHPFAVLLAELCIDHEGEGAQELVYRAWRLADKVYAFMASRIAEGETGPLWASIKKLMRRANLKRPRELTPASVAWGRLEFQRANLDRNMQPSPPLSVKDSPDFDVMQSLQFENMLGAQGTAVDPTWSSGWTPEPHQQSAWNNWGMFLDDMGSDLDTTWMTGISPANYDPSMAQSMISPSQGMMPPLQSMPPDRSMGDTQWTGL